MLIAAVILLAVNLATRDRGPGDEPANTLAGFAKTPRNLFAYLLYLAFPIPFALVRLALYWRQAPLLLVLPAVPVLIFHFASSPSRSFVESWPLAAALYGLAALGFMIYHAVRERDRTGLLLTLWVLIPLPLIIYSHLPVKYLLAVVPAIVLILIRDLSTLSRRRELSAYGAIVLACGIVFVRASEGRCRFCGIWPQGRSRS